MAKNSYVEMIQDWEKLLSAVSDSPEVFVETQELRTTLEFHMAKTRNVQSNRAAYLAEARKGTRELRAAVAQGRDLTMRLRAMIKCTLGPRDTRLTKFGIAPLRPRRKRA
jgi:hypothetical protein